MKRGAGLAERAAPDRRQGERLPASAPVNRSRPTAGRRSLQTQTFLFTSTDGPVFIHTLAAEGLFNICAA